MTNFELITSHFGDSVLAQVANTNFLVYLTNVYCLARKVKKSWLPLFEDLGTKQLADCVENLTKLCVTVTFRVFQNGILGMVRVSVQQQNYAVH